MLVQSLINDTQYYWVRVPRTATIAYGDLFSQYNKNISQNQTIDYHLSYPELYSIFNEPRQGISVVRHPKARLKSAIRFIINSIYMQCNRPEDKLPFNCSDMEQMCAFFTENIDIINKFRSKSPNDGAVVAQKVDIEIQLSNIPLFYPFFRTQTELALYPEVKIFKYELMSEFDDWIVENLGYDLSKLVHINQVIIPEDSVLDFDADAFDQLSRTLFAEDYVNFGYE